MSESHFDFDITHFLFTGLDETFLHNMSGLKLCGYTSKCLFCVKLKLKDCQWEAAIVNGKKASGVFFLTNMN